MNNLLAKLKISKYIELLKVRVKVEYDHYKRAALNKNVSRFLLIFTAWYIIHKKGHLGLKASQSLNFRFGCFLT